MRRFGYFFSMCAIAILVSSAHSANRSSADEPVLELTVPLDQGRLELRDVLAKIAENLGIKTGQSLADLHWSIDVQSALGQMQLHGFDRLTGGVVSTAVQGNQVTVRLDRAALKRQLAKTSRTIESWFEQLGGNANQEQHRDYGLTFVTANGDRKRFDELSSVPKRAVILVHGLDDPGFMWGDLIPQLQKAGYFVGRLDYPNDGPISESADLLAATLADARRAGIEHVDIVAHSMGGLVTRDVLTRPAYYHGDGTGDDKYPAIDRLIMVGAPNHGSELARLRGVTEIGEQLYRIMTGTQGSAPRVGDGSGEAGVDLLPDSDFLRRLNERPLATNVRYTIIAGQWSPIGAQRASTLIDKTEQLAESPSAPQWLRDWVSEKNRKVASSLISSAIDGLGDGCVTLESAKLAGVDDLVIVNANHVDMLLTIGSDKMPAAVPIILDRLKSDAEH
jgi:pimeloyl-ACP methyl ester carboxylesterase